MKVKFKNSETPYECTEPTEQKVFRSGEAIGWAIMFCIYGDLISSEIDEIITPATISELVFTNGDEEKTGFTVAGYSAISACIIRHKETSTLTELQFTKTVQNNNDKGVAENG